MPQTFQQLIPGFFDDLAGLHQGMLWISVIIVIAGSMFRMALVRHNASQIGMILARMCFISAVISNLGLFGDLLNSLANGVAQQAHFDMNQNVLADYQQALATKFAGQSNPWQFLFNQLEAIGIAILGVAIYFLSLVAVTIMFVVMGIVSLLTSIELAVSPVFIACAAIPSLTSLCTRFCTFFVSLQIIQIGYAAANIITEALLNVAVNSGNNGVVAGANALGGGILLWVAVAVWVILSSVLAPGFIVFSIVTNGSLSSALGGLMSAVTGTAVAATNAVTRTAGTGAALASSGGSSALTQAASGSYRNFAVRPPPVPTP